MNGIASTSGRMVALIGVAITLGACQVSPLGKELKPVSLPTSWRSAAGFPQAEVTADLGNWWRSFNDPILTELISISLEGSPDLRAAESAVRQARAQRASARSGLFPSLTGGLAGTGSAGRADGNSSVSSQRYAASLDASWEIDLFGKQGATVAAAGADEAVAEETLHSVQAALASEVALGYLDLRAAEARLAVVRSNVESREETYQLASWREKAGISDALETEQAASNLEQVRSSIPSLEQSASEAKNRLSVLAGRSPGALDGVLARQQGELPRPPRRLAVGIPADTLRKRPDVRSAGYAWVAAAHRTNVAKSQRLPSLSLSGSLGVDALSSSKLFNPDQAAASMIAGLTAPIFDAGRIRSQIEVQNEQQEQALQSYQSTVLQALSEVEDALIACRKNDERETITQRAVDAARTAATLATQRYEAGVVDMTTVLDAQRSLLSLEDQGVTVRADRAAAFVALYKALGGGWQA